MIMKILKLLYLMGNDGIKYYISRLNEIWNRNKLIDKIKCIL